MTNELTLADLHDIVEPTAVSIWPPAPGTWIILGIIVLIGALIAFKKWQAYRKDRYRRQALTELETSQTAGAIATILKRTALVAYPREDVISLQNHDWFEWLESESGLACPDAVRQDWNRIYAETEADCSALKTYTREWITHHVGI